MDDQSIQSPPSEEGKTRAIIAHITLIGTIIAIVQNGNNKDEFASFYIRQMLGLTIIGVGVNLLIRVIPSLYYIFGIFGIAVFALWILSLISAISGEKKPIPILGELFQDWFKSL